MGSSPANDSKQSDSRPTRRRGAELESAILDAAWEQLIAEGYEHFTVDTVAARARTSKPVLYRRWKTREDMLRATVRHRGAADPPAIPDTGTLRGDLLALLTLANTTRNPMAALVSSMLGSYYNQTGPTPAELRDAFLTPRGSAVEQQVDVAGKLHGADDVAAGREVDRASALLFAGGNGGGDGAGVEGGAVALGSVGAHAACGIGLGEKRRSNG